MMAARQSRRKPVSLWGGWWQTFALLLVVCLLASSGAWAQSGPAAPSGWNVFAHFVVHPWATIALLVFGCSLLYYDLLTPKTWDITGTMGVLFVGLVFAAQVTVGAAYLGVLLLLAGLALILLEIHVYPGHGSALAGFVLMFAGMFLSLDGAHHAAFALSVTTVLTIVVGIAFLAYLPKSPAWQRLGQRLGTQTALSPCAPDDERQYDFAQLIGKQGTTLTALRPSGTADFDGAQFLVVTEGDFLSSGTAVLVTEVEGDRVVVEPARAAAPVAA